MSPVGNLAQSVLEAPGFSSCRVGELGADAIPATQLAERARDVADRLRRSGLEPSEPVVLFVSNKAEDLVGFLGIWLAGGVAAPIHVSTPQPAGDALIGRLGARLAVRARQVEQIGTLAPASRPLLKQAALIVFTSGSTGQPKGVVLRHDALIWKLQALSRLIRPTPDDVVVVPLQLTFIFGIWVSLLSMMSGANLTLAPKLSARSLFVDAPSTTILAAVPTLLRTLCADNVRAPRLSKILTGGEPFTPALAEDLATRLPRAECYDLFGLTETGSCDFCLGPLDQPSARGTIGRPTEGVDFRILSMPQLGLHDGAGELLIRTPAMMAGYLDDPALTAAAFVDGYFRTGDLAVPQNDGYVRLVGRSKDVVSRGGNKIAPLEIENLFARHPAVAAVLAFGMPDERLGESLHLMIVARESSLTEKDLRSWAAHRLERFKTPDVIHFVAALPTGRTGKVDRAAARQSLGTPTL